MNLRQMHGLLVLAPIILVGCATVQPVPQLTRPESSGLGIAIKLRAPITWFSKEPDVIYFAKVDEEQDLLQPQKHQIIQSNYAKDGRVYLLNAPPGTYVAVAAFLSQAPVLPAAPPGPGVSVSFSIVTGRRGYTTYFPKDVVEQTRIKVGERDFAFMGSYVVDQSVGLGEADPVQTHYSNIIAPGAGRGGLLGQMFSGDYHYRGTNYEVKNDDQTRNEFFGKAREDLAEGGWAARLK